MSLLKLSDSHEELAHNQAAIIPLVSVATLVAALFGAYAVFFLSAESSAELSALSRSDTATSEEGRALLTLQDVAARFEWAIAGVIQTIVFVVVITFYCRELVAARRRQMWSLILIAMIVGAFAWMMRYVDWPNLPTELVRFALERSRNYVLAIVIDVENALALVLILTGTLATGAALEMSPRRLPSKSDIEHQIERVRFLLTLSAVALAAGVVQVFFEYRWVAAVLFPVVPGTTEESLTEFGISMASSVTLAAGATLSLFLAACFMPAALVLKTRVVRINKTLPKKQHISFGWELWFDAVKIVVPLLTAGPLSALFS